jgi:arylsulfatase A-like enzyme
MCLNRRQFLALAGLFAAPQRRARQPNALIFLSDQETERVDRSLLRLPHRDRLERSGVRFTRTWCATPQCSPARGALWTGLWPHRTGLVANVDAVGARPLTPDTPNLAQLFRAAGYRTGYFGKWHLTSNADAKAEAFGFDELRMRGDQPGDEGIARAAASWIEEQGDHPWLAIVSIIQPHDIYNYPREAARRRVAGEPPYPIRRGVPAPKSSAADLEERPQPQRLYRENDQGQVAVDYDAEEWRRYRTYYYELIEDADRSLGLVLEGVDRAGLAAETIVAYSSDHGDGIGAHGLPFKGPFQYEELLNIPLTISWPGRITAGESDVLASQVDLLPTLCDLAGAPAPGLVDGLSLRPALEGGSIGREELFAEYHSKQRWANPIRTVRDDRWKLSVYLDGGRELYDLRDDPDELMNRAGDSAAASAERLLYESLEAHAARTGDALWFEKLAAAARLVPLR